MLCSVAWIYRPPEASSLREAVAGVVGGSASDHTPPAAAARRTGTPSIRAIPGEVVALGVVDGDKANTGPTGRGRLGNSTQDSPRFVDLTTDPRAPTTIHVWGAAGSVTTATGEMPGGNDATGVHVWPRSVDSAIPRSDVTKAVPSASEWNETEFAPPGARPVVTGFHDLPPFTDLNTPGATAVAMSHTAESDWSCASEIAPGIVPYRS